MFRISVVSKKAGGQGYYIGRPSALGNRFTAKGHGLGIRVETVQQSIDMFEEWLIEKIKEKDPNVIKEINRIYTLAQTQPVNLVCWCAPGPCHGDVIKKFVSNMTMRCQ